MNVSEKEKGLLATIQKNFPEQAEMIHSALAQIFATYPKNLLSDKYDKEAVRSFLHALMKDSAEKGHEQYMQVVFEDGANHILNEKCLGTDDLLRAMMQSLGSAGVTKLIEDCMTKMADTKFTEQDVENLTDLIKMRNKLRQSEQKFLETAFAKFIQHQIDIYSKQL